jgi:hypothetical protein
VVAASENSASSRGQRVRGEARIKRVTLLPEVSVDDGVDTGLVRVAEVTQAVEGAFLAGGRGKGEDGFEHVDHERGEALCIGINAGTPERAALPPHVAKLVESGPGFQIRSLVTSAKRGEHVAEEVGDGGDAFCALRPRDLFSGQGGHVAGVAGEGEELQSAVDLGRVEALGEDQWLLEELREVLDDPSGLRVSLQPRQSASRGAVAKMLVSQSSKGGWRGWRFTSASELSTAQRHTGEWGIEPGHRSAHTD